MELHTISNYNQLRLNTLRDYEWDVHYAYVDSQGIPTIGIGLNLRVHGRLILQTLGFDMDGTQLTGGTNWGQALTGDNVRQSWIRFYS